MKKLPKKLLTPTARAGSQSGRGTSSVVPTHGLTRARSLGPERASASGEFLSSLPKQLKSPQSGEGQVPAGEQLLDPKGVGKRLKLSPRTVSEMANDGRLPAYRIGIYLRFKWVEVEQHLAASCRLANNVGTP